MGLSWALGAGKNWGDVKNILEVIKDINFN